MPMSSSWPFAAGRKVSIAAITAPARVGCRRQAIQGRRVLARDPRRQARDLGRVVAIAGGREHAGARVREQARGITVLLPEAAARREIDLRQRLRRQRRDRARPAAPEASGSIAMRRSTGGGTAAMTWPALKRRPLAQVDDGAVVLERNRRHRMARARRRCASAAAIASGMRCTPSRAVKPRLAEGASARCCFENAPRNNSSSAETSCASRPKLTLSP